MYTDQVELEVYRKDLPREDQNRTLKLLKEIEAGVRTTSDIGMTEAFITLGYLVCAMMLYALSYGMIFSNLFWLVVLAGIPIFFIVKYIAPKYPFAKRIAKHKEVFALLFHNDKHMIDSLQIIKNIDKTSVKNIRRFLPKGVYS